MEYLARDVILTATGIEVYKTKAAVRSKRPVTELLEVLTTGDLEERALWCRPRVELTAAKTAEAVVEIAEIWSAAVAGFGDRCHYNRVGHCCKERNTEQDSL